MYKTFNQNGLNTRLSIFAFEIHKQANNCQREKKTEIKVKC